MNIPRFSPRQPLTADALNKLGDAIRAYRVTSFVGGRIEQNTGGTSLILTAQTGGAGGGGDIEMLPFEVSLVTTAVDPENPNARPVFKVNPISYLWKGIGNIERVSISPFNTPGQPDEFFLPDAPGAIVVSVTFDEQMGIVDAFLESISMEEWPGGSASYPWPIERDTESTGANYLRQKKLHIIIAEVAFPTDERDGIVVTDEGVDKKVVQIIKSHLMLDWQTLDGVAAKVAIPWQDQPILV